MRSYIMTGPERWSCRTANCRRSLLAFLWLHAGCCGRVSGGEVRPSDVAGLQAELAAERVKTAQLQKQLEAERVRSDVLQAQLDSMVQAVKAADNAEPAHRLSPSVMQHSGLKSCPLTPVVNQSLPRGSYLHSCNECYRFGDSLRCSCFTKSQVSCT